MILFKYGLCFLYILFGLYGLLMLASEWAGGRTARSDLQFLLFGVAVPVVAWSVTFFVPYASLALPASLLFLYLRLSDHEAHGDADERAVLDDQLASAEQSIASDPDNAAAYWAKAMALERQGHRAAALKHFERAHALSDRAVTASELRDIRDRLADAPAAPVRRSSALTDRLELAGLLTGLALVPLNWVLGVDQLALLAFVAWHRRRDDPRVGNL